MSKVFGFDEHFCFYFFFTGWSLIAIGISIDISNPNIEIHLPFGFIKIGWQKEFREGYKHAK